MPYDYGRMIFSALIGYLAFAEIPDRWTWIGSAIIAGSAFYIARRESQIAHIQPVGGWFTDWGATSAKTATLPSASRRRSSSAAPLTHLLRISRLSRGHGTNVIALEGRERLSHQVFICPGCSERGPGAGET